jgi:hypothetical protein
VERHHADCVGDGCQTVCILVTLVISDSDFSSRVFFMNQFASRKQSTLLLFDERFKTLAPERKSSTTLKVQIGFLFDPLRRKNNIALHNPRSLAH